MRGATISERAIERHDVRDLVTLFNRAFAESDNTVLLAGEGDPLYRPATGGQPAVIEFAHGFFASAQHEIAHWCIAGEARRQQVDYGYWYKPTGRTAQEQMAFEQVEAKPQALEWFFARCSGYRFRLSVDNFAVHNRPSAAFCREVHAALERYLVHGMPRCAERWGTVLCEFYGQPRPSIASFQLPDIAGEALPEG